MHFQKDFLVYQPSVTDTGGRTTREVNSIPNHAFNSIIKTTGPSSQRYVTTSPVEVSIRRSSTLDDNGESINKSIISWNIALPPEGLAYYNELNKAVFAEDKEEGNDPKNAYE